METFKNHDNMDQMMAIRVNNFSRDDLATVDFVCASEIFISECPNAGLGGILLQTLDHINLCENLGAVPTIFWRQCESICPSDPTVNAWEMFFEPVNPKIEQKAKTVFCFGGQSGPSVLGIKNLDKTKPMEDLINLTFRPKLSIGYEETGIITRDVQIKTNKLIEKYVKILPKIQTAVEQFYSRYLAKFHAVAVHVRGTDHRLETGNGQLAPLSSYIQNIKDFLLYKSKVNRIFVATDNSETIETFVQEFEDKVVYTKAFRAKAYDGLPVHASGFDAYKLGSEVLVDILLMAKCKYFFHMESSVAALVTYFNPRIESHFVKHSIPTDVTSSSLTTNSPHSSNKHQQNIHHIANALDHDGINDSREQQEEEKDQEDSFKCFLENRRYSVCPNFHTGKVARLKDVLEMTIKNKRMVSYDL
ncbi:hypothetical protein AC249_AIPGENE9375 [Exaiptasia diaphana]|nr:hypothetical protein AC249_AIPGENE9375 [Exaiptasia diaphana]